MPIKTLQQMYKVRDTTPKGVIQSHFSRLDFLESYRFYATKFQNSALQKSNIITNESWNGIPFSISNIFQLF